VSECGHSASVLVKADKKPRADFLEEDKSMWAYIAAERRTLIVERE